MGLKEIRRSLVIAMGSRCSECSERFEPDALIIHHTKFDEGKPLGYNNRQRQEMLYEFARTDKVPPDTKLLCDRCNRKHHKYRRSNIDIFGSVPKRRQIVKRIKQSMPASPPEKPNCKTCAFCGTGDCVWCGPVSECIQYRPKVP